MKWCLGRVVKLHYGKDGVPRSADLKTKKGISIRNRSIQRLHNLELSDREIDFSDQSQTESVQDQISKAESETVASEADDKNQSTRTGESDVRRYKCVRKAPNYYRGE